MSDVFRVYVIRNNFSETVHIAVASVEGTHSRCGIIKSADVPEIAWIRPDFVARADQICKTCKRLIRRDDALRAAEGRVA